MHRSTRLWHNTTSDIVKHDPAVAYLSTIHPQRATKTADPFEVERGKVEVVRRQTGLSDE